MKDTKVADVAFASIDARDNGLTGYSPVAFIYTSSTRGEEKIDDLSEENYRTAQMMEREYLVRLNVLQEEIRTKYAPLFNMKNEPVMNIWENDKDDKRARAIDKEVKALFPGEEAEYYT